VADRARPLDLVVNNAGFGTYGDFAGLDIDGEQREIAVNVVALVRITHAALGGMLGRGHGSVLNVSSVAGLQATPGNATYGATKAFVASFGEAVHGELAGTGVTLTTVLPGYTRTEFQDRAGIGGRQIPGPAWQAAEEVAAQALDAARAGKAWFVPGTFNKVAVAAATPVPRGLRRKVAARMAQRM
jgi:short-subunit dehydrogenase